MTKKNQNLLKMFVPFDMLSSSNENKFWMLTTPARRKCLPVYTGYFMRLCMFFIVRHTIDS